MADTRLGIFSRNDMFVDDGTVTVNGIMLGDIGWYLTSAPEVDAISFDTSYTSVTGAHGSRDMTLVDEGGMAYAGRRTVTLHLRTVGTWQEAVKSKLALGSMVGRDARITWQALPGDFIGRLESSNPSEVWKGGVFAYYEIDLTMSAMPMLYGAEVTSGGKTLVVAGNCRVFPRFTALVNAGSILKIERDDGVFLEVATEQKAGAVLEVTVETAPDKGRGAYVADAPVCPTLASDFFDLPHGEVSLQVTGINAAMPVEEAFQITYEPLWLIP